MPDFELKNSADGLLYREKGSDGTGELIPKVDMLYVVYSKEIPEGSAQIQLGNETDYTLVVDDVKVNSKTMRGSGGAIIADENGNLSMFDNILFVEGQKSVRLIF